MTIVAAPKGYKHAWPTGTYIISIYARDGIEVGRVDAGQPTPRALINTGNAAGPASDDWHADWRGDWKSNWAIIPDGSDAHQHVEALIAASRIMPADLILKLARQLVDMCEETTKDS